MLHVIQSSLNQNFKFDFHFFFFFLKKSHIQSFMNVRKKIVQKSIHTNAT